MPLKIASTESQIENQDSRYSIIDLEDLEIEEESKGEQIPNEEAK